MHNDAKAKTLNALDAVFQAIKESEQKEEEHTVYRTRRNESVLRLLRGIEMFGGQGVCPVCQSPSKKNPKDLHDDKCELEKYIAHFESCVKFPGLW